MLYASYIVAMLSHLTFPGGTNLHFRGLHVSMSSVLRRRSRKLSLESLPSNFRTTPTVKDYLGTHATFVQLLSMLQLHLLMPAAEPDFWNHRTKNWFPEARSFLPVRCTALLGLRFMVRSIHSPIWKHVPPGIRVRLREDLYCGAGTQFNPDYRTAMSCST